MNLSFFETLGAVIKHGSFARAAAEVNLSPSTVSLQMKRLEEYFGQLLFDRSGPGVRPTPFAHEIAAMVSGTLEQMEALRRRSSPVVQGVVTLGSIESMQALLLPEAMRHLKQRFPGVEIRLVRDNSQSLLGALKEGAIDAAVVAFPTDARSSRLSWHALLQEEMVLVAPPHATEASAPELLRAYDFIHFDRNSSVWFAASRYLADAGLSVVDPLQMGSTQAILAMVSSGLGVSILFWPDRRLLVSYPVREVKLGANAPRLYVSFVQRKSEEDSRLLTVVRDAFIRSAGLAAGRAPWSSAGSGPHGRAGAP